MNWAEEEFKTMEFGDAWLDRRAVLLAEQLSQRMRSHPVVLCQDHCITPPVTPLEPSPCLLDNHAHADHIKNIGDRA